MVMRGNLGRTPVHTMCWCALHTHWSVYTYVLYRALQCVFHTAYRQASLFPSSHRHIWSCCSQRIATFVSKWIPRERVQIQNPTHGIFIGPMSLTHYKRPCFQQWMNWPMLNMMLNPILMQILGNMQSLQNLLLMQKVQNMQHLQIMQHMQKRAKYATCSLVKIWSWSLVAILKLESGCHVETEVWSRFWLWSLVTIFKLKFGRDF